MRNIGDLVRFRTWDNKVLEGTITEIDYNQICVDVEDSDYWILEEEILNKSVL